MGLWLKGYEYREINKKINDYLKIEKEIFFQKEKMRIMHLIKI